MNLLSPSRTRFAFGPGSAVLILGVLRVVVVMGSSKDSSLVVRHGRFSERRTSTPIREQRERILEISRYRRGWGADAKAARPDSGADTPANAASRRVNANWGSGSASVLIPFSL